MFETEEEIKEEIQIVSTAIRNIMLTGQEYQIGTGSSQRTFKMADLDKLRNYKHSLEQELLQAQGCSGVVVSY